MGVKEHGIKGELGPDSLADVEEVEHLLDGLVSLLSHTSIQSSKVSMIYIRFVVEVTCEQEGFRR